jgi:hypothetical protein
MIDRLADDFGVACEGNFRLVRDAFRLDEDHRFVSIF